MFIVGVISGVLFVPTIQDVHIGFDKVAELSGAGIGGLKPYKV
jgi:hypothetical protein